MTSHKPGTPMPRNQRTTLRPLLRSLVSQMLETGGIATWVWDLASDRVRLQTAQDHLSEASIDSEALPVGAVLESVHREDRQRADEWLQALRKGEPAGELRYRAVHRSGRMRYYVTNAAICIGGHKLRYLLGTVQDVSGRTHIERRLLHKQAVLLQLARDVQTRSVDTDAALRQITAATGKTLGVDRVTVWLLDRNEPSRLHCTIQFDARGHSEPTEKPVRVEWLPRYFEALWKERVVAVGDTEADPRVSEILEPYLRPRGIRAMLDIAVLRGGESAGIVSLDRYNAPHHWQLDEQQFAISVADLLSTVLEQIDRQAAEQALARSEALLHDLVNYAPSVVYVKDPGGTYLLANRKFEDIVGADNSDIVGRTDEEVLTPELAAALRDHHRTVVESQQPLEVVERLPLPDGERTYLSTKFPLFDRSGQLYGAATIASDITDYEKMLQQLRESQLRTRELAEASFEAVLIHDNERVLEFNSNLLEMFGYSRSEIQGLHPSTLTAPQDRPLVTRMAASGTNTHYESWGLRADGSIFPMEIRGRAADLNGKPVRVVALRDLTEQKANEKALRANEERYRAFIAATAEAIWRADVDPPMPVDLDLDEQTEWLYRKVQLAECNQAMARMYGFDRPEDAVGLTMADIYDERFFRKITNRFVRLGYYVSETEVPYRNRKGEFVWMNGSFFGVVEDGRLQRVWCIQRDVTERRRHVAELEYQATHDPLTGLFNRKWLTAAVDTRIADDPLAPLALLFIDLDHFKEINDTLGHHIGDLLLSQIGSRLMPMLGDAAHLARLGGDEFAVLISHFVDQQSVLDLTRAIVQEIRRPFEVAGLRLEVGASIGVALFPDHGQDTSALMRCADIAMYLAKRDRLGWAVYRPDLDEHSPRRLALMTELGPAMREGQLFLVYQPKLHLQTGAPTGFEALIRWQHPLHGRIPPAQFIPLAEMGEIIRPLTLWVVEHALMQLQAWLRQGLETAVAVNVSPRNLLDEELPDQLLRLIARYRVPPAALQLEITEGALIDDPERALEVIQRIHALGVRFAIDDFGTGYSSLAYLKRLPLDTIKIDLSFVRQMLQSQPDAMIVRSMVGLAHNLGLRVVAEGVEDAATLAALRDLGCDEAQGYYIAKPLPVEQATERMVETKPLIQ